MTESRLRAAFCFVAGSAAAIRPLSETKGSPLVGQLCTPKDVLARTQTVEALALGDCPVFPLAGAFAWNISHQKF